MSDHRALERILHVEDDASIAAIARLALESVGGYTVCSCSGGRSAVAEAPAFDPDLVLIDVMMPDMDGPTTLAALSEVIATQRIPLVFMTARIQPAEHRSYIDLGAADVIVKPFDPMTLAEQIAAIWRRFHGR